MEYAFRSTLTRFLLIFTVLALAAGTVWAQGTGEITGLVTDPQGAVVSDATVTLTNSATGDKRTTVTSAAGIYRFPQLPVVGTYTLEVAPKGFKSYKAAGIVVSVGTTVSQDVKLELGAATEQVTVEAGAEVVQTTESSLSQLVDRNVWQNAPLQVRNQNSFIELVAGAVPQDGTNNNRGAEVNGTRGGAGSYLVEGADNNEQGQAGRGQISFYDKGGAATSISPDAIQEYRVITNSYSAEYGKGGGFITDTVLKSGTNQWHGSAFEYNRIQALAANDWFSNNVGNKDRLVRNQFGGSIGGPIIKDKTFFYGTGELHRVRQGVPLTATATTQQFQDFIQSGAFEAFQESDPNGFCVGNLGAACPGQLNTVSTLGPIFSTLSANPAMNWTVANAAPCDTSGGLASPDPRCVGAGFFTAGMVYPVPVYQQITVADPSSQNEARFSIKVDHRINERDSLSGSYIFQDATYVDKYIGGNNFIGPEYIQDGRGQNVNITWNHTFSPTILNTAKIGYLRHRNDFPAPPGTDNAPAYYTIDGLGVDLGIGTGSPQFFTDQQFQYQDSVSVTHGKHNLKMGAEYRRIRNASQFFNDVKSTVLPWGVEDTLTDLNFTNQAELLAYGAHYYGGAYYVSASIDPTTGKAPDVYRGYRANEFAAFAQDDFRVTSRLTVNLGLRWEYYGPPHNFRSGIDSNFYFGTTVTPFPTIGNPTTGVNPFIPITNPFYAGVASGRIATRDHEIWNKDTNNFSPRVGFAWDVFGTQKFVVRAGFGLMYDRIYNNVYENIRFNPPFFSDNQIGAFKNGVPAGPELLAFPFTDTTRALFNDPAFAPKPNPRHMDQNIVTPYYEQFHLGTQWEFAKGWVFEPEYVGTFGKKLIGLSDINTFDGRVAFGSTCSVALGNTIGCRINNTIGADNFRSNGYFSNYHALQASLRKAYSSGLTMQLNYTYSKALDDVSDLFNNGASSAGQGRPTDNMDHKVDYGPADFDTRHRFVGIVSYELPFMKNNRFLGGWGTNAIISYQTGHPWTPFSGSSSYDLNKDGIRSDRVVPVGSVESTLTPDRSPAHGTVDPSLWVRYTCPVSVNEGLWCNPPIGRNSVFGPSGANVDFNISKAFKLTERAKLTFQANFFDLFNHPNFLNPTAGTSGTTNLSIGPDFGKSRGTWGDNGGHRVTQLALRFDF